MAINHTNQTCTECNGQLRRDETELVCEDCGLVVDEDPIDRGPEWRSFEDDEDDPRRTGAPLTRSRHDRGLSTEIGYGTGSRITGRKRRQLVRMRREHNRARISTKAEYNQIYGFTSIRRLTTDLSLPDSARDQACTLFESAQSEDLLRGRSIEGFSAASVYAVCRTLSIARTLSEIVAVSRATEAELKVAYDALNRELGLPTGPIDPKQYLPRYASKLDLESSVQKRAREFVETLADNHAIGGRNPSGVAAGCLYAAAVDSLACDGITQAAASNVADVTPVTIRSTLQELQDLNEL